MHLAAISAFAVGQPVFSILEGNPELLVFRGLTRSEVIGVALLVALAPAAIALAYVWLAARISAWAANALYVTAVGLLLVPIGLQLAKRLDLAAHASLLAASVFGIAGAIVYARSRLARAFVGYAIVLPIVGFLWFVQGAPVPVDRALAASDRTPVAAPTPVVVVVLDELPVSSLMTTSGGIDAVRYPSFARLARAGTWYVNATTVHDYTADSLPALLSGRVTQPDAEPFLADHPENLLSLLGGSYALRVHETSSRLCPPSDCADRRGLLARLDGLFSRVGYAYLSRILPSSVGDPLADRRLEQDLVKRSSETLAQYDEMLAELEEGPSDALYFSHLLLPHAPWRFLPSGLTYRPLGVDGISRSEVWTRDPWPITQGFQRHLLQLAFVDATLGRLVHTLERLRLFDSALVVVVADHGVSFRPGDSRRSATQTNVGDIANVPLFVKYPHQRRGRVDARAVSTLDVAPTIADVLGVRFPWRVDGSSLLARIPEGRQAIVAREDGSRVRASVEAIERARTLTVRRKATIFGEGHDSIFRIGTTLELLGRRAPAASAVPTAARARIDYAGSFAVVDRASHAVPAQVTGSLDGVEAGTELAVAVNGRVRALTYGRPSSIGMQFRALVPGSVFEDGYNRVDVYAVGHDRSSIRLVWLGSSAGTP